jgi:hypothetical protein
MGRSRTGRSVYFYFISVLLSITIISCLANAVFDSGEFAVFDYEDAMDAVENASLDEEMELDPEIFNGNAFRSGHLFGPQAPFGPMGQRRLRHRTGNHLGEILKTLDLTGEQILQVRELMASHRDCIQDPLAAIRETSQEIINEVNQERHGIVNAHMAGQMTNKGAAEQIESLNLRTRERIREDLQNQEQKVALCECKVALFEGIFDLLDEDQRALWLEWVAGLECPCLDAV